MKGAAEYVLNSCQYYIDINGTKQPLDDSRKQAFIHQIETYAS